MVITTVYIYVHECVCVCVVKKSWLDCVLLTKALPAKQYSTILCVCVCVCVGGCVILQTFLFSESYSRMPPVSFQQVALLQ